MGVEPITFPVYKTGALPIVRHRRTDPEQRLHVFVRTSKTWNNKDATT
jgi:hypothetical protein